MKLLPINIQTTNFNSKHKDIRKADDIMRQTNLAFPMFNPSYAYYFYDSIDLKKPEKYPQREIFECGICQKFIREVRKPNDFMEDFETKYDIPHAYLLELLKSKKMGNCKETAITTLCSLYANGYYNSQRVSLGFDYKFIDKNSKEVILQGEEDLDHSAVMTDLNIPERKNNLNRTIIIDPWLEYTGTVSEANGKYKMQFGKLINENIEKIANNNNIDLDCHEVKTNIYYTYSRKFEPEEAKRIGQYVKRQYPELIEN